MLRNNIYKIFILTTLLLSSSGYSFAQEAEEAEQDCSVILKQAESTYDAGKIENVPSLLEKCIEKGFSKEEKLRAYKLIISSYLFDDKQEKANEFMLKLLKLDPEYELNKTTETTEFIQLFETYRTEPVYSIGFFGGLNLTNYIVNELYGIHNISNINSDFNTFGFGFQVGANINRYLAKGLEISIQPMLSRNTYSYSDSIFDFTYVDIYEQQTRIDLPISLIYEFGDKNIRPYARIGISTNYILSVPIEATRVYTDNAHPNISGTDINIIDFRRKLNFSSIAGLGVKYKIPRGFLIFDTRYNYGILNQVNTNQRYTNPELIYKYYYVDNNFKLNNLMFSIGYVYSIYKPELNMQNK